MIDIIKGIPCPNLENDMRELMFSLLYSSRSEIKFTLNKEPYSDEYQYEYYDFSIADNDLRITCDELGRFVRFEVRYDD